VTTYYVDATTGSDSDDGLSEANAWQTISKINGFAFSAGDVCKLKRGEVWREQWAVNTGGASGNPVTYDAYGTGELPKITGCDLLTGWTLVSGSVYRAAFTESIDIYLLLEDDVMATLVASQAAVDGAGKFWHDATNNFTYYWAIDSADPDTHTMEIGARYDVVGCDDRAYIAINNIHMHGAGGQFGHGFGIDPTWLSAESIVLSGCKISQCWYSGVWLTYTTGFTPTDGFEMHDCEVSYSGHFGVRIGGENAANRITNSVLDNCHIHDNGFDITANGEFGIWTVFLDGLVITNCHIHDNQGQFDWSGNMYITNTLNAEVSYCDVHDGYKNNIHFDTACNGFICKYNLSHDAALWNGIWVEDHEVASGASYIYNNTIWNCKHGLVFGPGGGTINEVSGVTAKNNIFDKCHRAAVELNEDGVGADYLNNTLDYNLYLADDTDPDYQGQFRAENPRVNKTFTQWKTYTSWDANSFNVTAQMIDPTNGNFRLQAPSPCIDEGTPVSLTPDYAGTTVPQGVAPDMGAYEFTFAKGRGLSPNRYIRPWKILGR